MKRQARAAAALKPLAGVRVLDVANVLAGPFACHQLAHLGAEVIKVEAAGRGDLARRLGADAELNAKGMGVSFLAQNAGKKSITLNLKLASDKKKFLQLAKTADVVVENFRPGVMARLGAGYDALKKIKPDIIYCAISGFGQDGPWARRPAYDQIIQGAAGVMSITGEAGGAPLRAGFPIADTIGGLTAAFAVCAALHAKPRGAFLDVSMLESILSTMGWAVSNHLIAGAEARAHGNENPTSAPSGAFAAADGLVNIAANKEEQWLLLIRRLKLLHLKDDKKYAAREARKKNRKALKAELEEVLRTRSAAFWEKELNALGVPAGAVLSVGEVLESAQVARRGFLKKYKNAPGVGRDIQVATTGIKINGKALSVDAPPPTLGQHEKEVWADVELKAGAGVNKAKAKQKTRAKKKVRKQTAESH